MATARTATAIGTQTVPPAKKAKSFIIADRGINTSRDFADMMSALMSDVVHGRVNPNISNAVCNAGGKLLKVIEMEYKYSGRPRRTVNRLSLAKVARLVK